MARAWVTRHSGWRPGLRAQQDSKRNQTPAPEAGSLSLFFWKGQEPIFIAH